MADNRQRIEEHNDRLDVLVTLVNETNSALSGAIFEQEQTVSDLEKLFKGLPVDSASSVDVRDTTATASDVATGKVFYDKDGVKTTGVLEVSSGDIGTGNYYLKVIDYDGTILVEKRLNNGDTYTLPNAPSHDGLVFQEWSCSQEIVDGVITIANNNVMVGATYTTASGLSEFDITLTKATGLDVTLKMDGTKNWGDGTSDDLTTHTYGDYGDYTITCNGTTMSTSYYNGIFGNTGSNKNYYCTSVRLGDGVTSIRDSAFINCYSLINVIIHPSVTSIVRYAFQNCYSLTNVVIPKSVTSIGTNTLANCYSLTNVVIPKTLTKIPDNFVDYCYSLTNVVIPQGVINIGGSGSSMFGYCYSLTNVVIPKSVTSISDSAFRYCYAITKYDFTQCTSIPTLSSSNIFVNINSICKIYVPDALYDEWIVATNWSTYADYIYKASEMEVSA